MKKIESFNNFSPERERSFNNFSPKFDEKREENNKERQREFKNIQEAIDFSLLATFEIKGNKKEDKEKRLIIKKPEKATNLSEYEKSLFDTLLEKDTLPKINLLVDIDGVLTDSRGKIKELSKILFKIKEFPENIAEFRQKLKETKIPYSSLKTFLQCRDKTENICLVTDRLGFGSTYYPFFNKKSQDIFRKHGIQVQTDVFKPLSFGRQFLKSLKKIDEQFLKMIEEGDITYYFGSGPSDEKFIRGIRQEMQKKEIPQEKVVFSLITLDNQ